MGEATQSQGGFWYGCPVRSESNGSSRYAAAEALTMATSTNAELLAMSGPRNPYPGKLGVVEEGALADLLLVDGNPLENIKLIEVPEKNLVVIMKDGTIYKNLLR